MLKHSLLMSLAGLLIFQGSAVFGASDSANVEEAPSRSPDVIFVPTPEEVVDEMLTLARVSKSDVVYDLGSGDGRIVVAAAKNFGARAEGFDIDPVRVQEGRENIRRNKVEHLAKIHHKDLFEVDLSKATVVTLYLLPSLNVRLIPQLEKMKPGSRIVSYDFDMEGVRPDRVIQSRFNGKNIYLWTTPLKRTTRYNSNKMRRPDENFKKQRRVISLHVNE